MPVYEIGSGLGAWLLRGLHFGRGRPAAIAVLLAVTAALYLPAEAPLKRLRLVKVGDVLQASSLRVSGGV